MGTNKEVAERWIQYAEFDLESAKILSLEKEYLFHSAMFHAQQATEKSIKAMLIIEEIKFSKTHDLNKLLALLEEKKEIDSKLYSLIAPFDDFTVEIRYPDYSVVITEKMIRSAIHCSSEIIKLAKEKINPGMK